MFYISNVVLVSYSGMPLTFSSLLPDNGLANLAASLLEHGHNVKVLDYGTVDTVRKLRIAGEDAEELYTLGAKIAADLDSKKEPCKGEVEKLHSLEKKLDGIQQEKTLGIAREIVKKASEESADFVGLKLWNGDGFTGSLMIAGELKKRFPGMPVFGGGPHADWFREAILMETKDIDALAYGDGEETIVSLADYVSGKKRLGEIPGLIYRDNGDIKTNPLKWVEDLDKLPLPVYNPEIYPAMQGDEKIRIITLDESRGCPRGCYFCIQPVKSGSSWRLRDAKKIVDDMEELGKRYGVKAFRYAGSNTPHKLAKEIAKEILGRGLDITYSAFSHGMGSYGDFELMKDAGCYSLFFGIETGSPELMEKYVNKGINPERIKNTIIDAKKAGILTVGSIIMPLPGENSHTKRQTLDFLLESRPDSVTLCPPGIIPGTEWGDNPENYSMRLSDSETFKRDFMRYKIKLLFPGQLWDPMPYSVDGKSSNEFLAEMSEFSVLLEKNGILTMVPDDMMLIAKYSGMPAREFRDINRHQLLSGDYKGARSLVREINRRLG